MREFLKERFPNEGLVKNTEFLKFGFKHMWYSFIEDAKSFMEKRQSEIYFNLLDECNNTAIYLPRGTANEIAIRKQRSFKQLVNIGTENLYQKNLLIDFIGHIPPFVLVAVRSFKESGIMNHMFDFISSTSNLPPTKSTLPSKPTMEGNIAVVFIILLGGFGISLLIICGENYRTLYKWMKNPVVIIWQAFFHVTNLLREFLRSTKVHPIGRMED